MKTREQLKELARRAGIPLSVYKVGGRTMVASVRPQGVATEKLVQQVLHYAQALVEEDLK